MRKLTAVVLLALIVLACSKGGSGGPNPNPNPNPGTCNTAPSFSGEVNPIIQSTCAISTCHEAGSINGPGPLLTHTQIFNARTAIRTAIANGTMPKTGSLTTAQKNTIFCWIDKGAPNN